MDGQENVAARSSFRRLFLRGLTILLPTILTLWILIAAYGFVQERIADPINRGVRRLVLTVTPWPRVTAEDLAAYEQQVQLRPDDLQQWYEIGRDPDWLAYQARRSRLDTWWGYYAFPLNLIGLIIAIALIYAMGVLLSSLLGAQLIARIEELIMRLPILRQLYPSVKQVTDFVVGGGEQKMRFNRVVAVEYPRKGVWSIGLVTGSGMKPVADKMGRPCLTLFMPSSPTPFTGYVIMALEEDTLELPMTIEQAVRFLVSGGVIMPGAQKGQVELIPASTPNNPADSGDSGIVVRSSL